MCAYCLFEMCKIKIGENGVLSVFTRGQNMTSAKVRSIQRMGQTKVTKIRVLFKPVHQLLSVICTRPAMCARTRIHVMVRCPCRLIFTVRQRAGFSFKSCDFCRFQLLLFTRTVVVVFQ